MTNKFIFGLCILITVGLQLINSADTLTSVEASNSLAFQPVGLLSIGLIACFYLRKSISNK